MAGPRLAAATVLALVLVPAVGLAGGGDRSGATAGDRPAIDRRVEIDGIAVNLSLATLDGRSEVYEGDTVRLRVELADTASASPLVGAWPAAWMDLLPAGRGEEPTSRAACVDKVEEFIAGSLLAQAELDLNVYYIVALNDDATLTVVDPLFGFGGSRLLALVELESPGEDWVLDDARQRLFVSQPAAGRLAVVRTTDWTIERQIAPGAAPRRLVLTGDGARLWAVDDEGVTVLDTETLEIVARVPLAGGPHELAFDDRDRFAFVTLRNAGAVAVFDAQRPRSLRVVDTGVTPSAIAFSAMAAAVYVAHQSGTIVGIDAEHHRIVARAEAEPGLASLRFAPDGRRAFVVNPEANLLHVLDTASNRIVQSGPMAGAPDQVMFTDELAYVRHRESEHVLMLPLDAIGVAGEPFQAADFPGGSQPLGIAGRAEAIVRAPGANAVVVAHPDDEAIYYYVEGMAAPMGHFRNYGHPPRAVLVVDRSLGETRPGVYETSARIDKPGVYDLAVFLDAPRVVHCFRVRVAEDPKWAAARRPALRARLAGDASLRDGVAELIVELDDATGQPLAGVADLTLLAVQLGRWHRLEAAREVGEGRYQAAFRLPGSGFYQLYARAPSRGLSGNGVQAGSFRLGASSRRQQASP